MRAHNDFTSFREERWVLPRFQALPTTIKATRLQGILANSHYFGKISSLSKLLLVSATLKHPHMLRPGASSGCSEHLLQDFCHWPAALLYPPDPACKPQSCSLLLRQRHKWQQEVNSIFLFLD